MHPFVSVLCPTRDRRTFLPAMLAVYDRFEWPKDRRELIVVDDGRDNVADVFAGREDVRYEHLGVRVALGSKRNRLAELATAEIHVNLDDDDWSPPDRIARAVALLTDNVDVVGRSDLAFWDGATDTVRVQPRVGPKHVTAGSMAYRAGWWRAHRWMPDPHTEERQFLANFTARVVQPDGPSWRWLLAIGHGGNLLPKSSAMPPAGVRLEDIVTDADLHQTYRAWLAEDAW